MIRFTQTHREEKRALEILRCRQQEKHGFPFFLELLSFISVAVLFQTRSLVFNF